MIDFMRSSCAPCALFTVGLQNSVCAPTFGICSALKHNNQALLHFRLRACLSVIYELLLLLLLHTDIQDAYVTFTSRHVLSTQQQLQQQHTRDEECNRSAHSIIVCVCVCVCAPDLCAVDVNDDDDHAHDTRDAHEYRGRAVCISFVNGREEQDREDGTG